MIGNFERIKRFSGKIVRLLEFLGVDECKNHDRAVFFDVDGTLSRDDCLELLISTVMKKRLISDEKNNLSYECARDAWKNHDISFHNYLELVIEATKGLRNLSQRQLYEIVDDLVENKGYYYLFTWLTLIRLKTMGYKLIAVSGAPDFMLGKFLKNAGIFVDSIHSTKYIFKDGKFSGEIDLSVTKDKGAYIRKNFGNKIDLSKSLALGDTINDVKLLEAVGKAITVNPTYELAQIAKKNKWPIIIERKNLVIVSSEGTIPIN